VSKSGCPFDLRPVSLVSSIGHDTPSQAALMHRGVRYKKMTTKRTKATPSVAAATLAQAFKVKILNLFSSYQFKPILILSFQGVLTTSGTSSVTLLCTRHLLFLMSSRNIPLLLYSTIISCNSKPVHRQGSKMFNNQLPMPPSQQLAKLNP